MFVERPGVIVWLASGVVYFEKSKCLKRGNFNVQVEGMFMIYSVEIDRYSAYIEWVLFSNFCIFGV
jgi:hypothetical protein